MCHGIIAFYLLLLLPYLCCWSLSYHRKPVSSWQLPWTHLPITCSNGASDRIIAFRKCPQHRHRHPCSLLHSYKLYAGLLHPCLDSSLVVNNAFVCRPEDSHHSCLFEICLGSQRNSSHIPWQGFGRSLLALLSRPLPYRLVTSSGDPRGFQMQVPMQLPIGCLEVQPACLALWCSVALLVLLNPGMSRSLRES